MMHDYHDALPGYDERQIWHDGCAECEHRGETLNIGALDHNNFALAWERAAEFNQRGSFDMAISRAEAPLLNMLWSIQVQLERRGWPLGVVPSAATAQTVETPSRDDCLICRYMSPEGNCPIHGEREPVEPEQLDMSGATPGAER